VCLGSVDIGNFLLEEIELKIEWSLNLKEVILMDLIESILSGVEEIVNVVNSVLVDGVDQSNELISESTLVSSESSSGPVIIIVWLDTVVSDKVVMSIWGRVLVSNVGSTSHCVGVGSASISHLVLHVVSM
jgi:hypothetical protein